MYIKGCIFEMLPTYAYNNACNMNFNILCKYECTDCYFIMEVVKIEFSRC